MSDVYFIQVKGNGKKELAKSIEKKQEEKEENITTLDNIIIVPEEVEPLNKDEARECLEQMANKLDMVVKDGKSI